MKVYFLPVVSTILCFGVGSSSCGNTEEKVSDSAYAQALVAERKQKDNDFAGNPKSPFASLATEFEGLKYYDPDPAWNVEASWVQPDTTYVRQISDSKGGIRRYVYAGNFGFQIHKKDLDLDVFREEGDSSGMLFIMFRDKTNGRETYGGGRYIEMLPPAGETRLNLDFNRAFNPYCHYNHDYSCPVIPQDCVLDVEIKAGEKQYKKE